MSNAYNPYSQPYGYQPRRRGNNTCLVLVLIFGVLGMVGLLIVGVGAYFLYRNFTPPDVQIAQMQQFQAIPANNTTKMPVSLDDALVELGKNFPDARREAARFLARMELTEALRAVQPRVAVALVDGLRQANGSDRDYFIAALEVWMHPDASLELAKLIKKSDADARFTLSLLQRGGVPECGQYVAPFLEVDKDSDLAYETLKALGPDAAGYVATYLTSNSKKAAANSAKLVKELGVDPAQLAVDRILNELRDGERDNDEAALKNLAALQFDEELQKRVTPLLNSMLEDNVSSQVEDELLTACEKWANESTAPALTKFMDSHPFSKQRVLKMLGQTEGDSSITALVSEMAKFGSGNEAVTALIKKGEAAVPYVIKHFNDNDDTTRRRAREIINALEVPEDKILDQCIQDLKVATGKNVVETFKWIGTIELNETKRDAVAAAMASRYSSVSTFEKDDVLPILSKWATRKQANIFLDQVDESFGWEESFKILINMNVPDLLAPEADEILTSFFKKEEAGKMMRAAGPIVEDFAIVMTKRLNDDDALSEMAIVLGLNGTEKSLKPLQELQDRATAVRSAQVIANCKGAIKLIKERVAKEKKEQGETTPDTDSGTKSQLDDK